VEAISLDAPPLHRVALPDVAGNGRAGGDAHDSLLYGELAKVYDLIFARVFYPRIARTIRQLRIPPGSRVLEIGVGTGLSLSAYPRHCRVLGLDRSPEMLKHARRKIEKLHLRHIRLVEGDALHLPFEPASFDYAMAFHVITVVPDHARLLAEARRVLRPGGTLVVINHFRSKSPWLSRFEKNLEPVSKRWGWTTLDVREATAHMGDPDLYRRSSRRGTLFTVLVARQPGVGARGGRQDEADE
jgi:phosphatidylethanolamine/phosphatidyl-N-methylethanolamine N-methyltransferase